MLARLVLGATGLGRVATTGAARWATGARFSPRVLTKECPNAGQTVDYKNTQLLSSYVSDQTGQINRADVTGLCAKCQRKVARAIKRARNFGLMPYTYKMEIYSKDA